MKMAIQIPYCKPGIKGSQVGFDTKVNQETHNIDEVVLFLQLTL
jgi:hypothetical protein